MKDASKSGFPTVPLSNVATIVNGGTPKSKVAKYWGGDVQWLTPKDMGQMKSREIAETPRTITQAGLKDSSARLVPAGSVILSTRAPIGHLAMNTEPMAFNQGCRGIIPSGKLDPVYLYHFLNMSRELLNELGSGTTFKELSGTSLKSVQIPLPPLEEQQRIVVVLDEAFEGLARARAHAEANLKNARELLAAELYRVFEHALSTAPERTFEEITSDSLIGLVRSKKEQGTDKQFDYVKMQNIGNDDRYLGGVLDRIDCSPEEEARYQLKCGDLLFNTRNSRELVGKSCLIEEDFERPTVFNNNIMRVRFSSEIFPRYIALAFKSSPVKAQLEAMKSGTTSVVAIYHKSLKKLRLPVPNQKEQRTLVDRFDELDSAIRRLFWNYKKQVDDISDLRQSLLQKAFAGELT